MGLYSIPLILTHNSDIKINQSGQDSATVLSIFDTTAGRNQI